MLEILLVDDEPSIRLTVADALRADGHNVTTASDGAEALGLLSSNAYDVVITDVRMPRADGKAVLQRAKASCAKTDVILITAYAAVSDAVAALKDGADDYLTKPFDMEELKVRIQRIAEKRALESALAEARAELDHRSDTTIIGASPPMLRLLDRLETIAVSDAPVLITGESGTGKELVAKCIHEKSERRAKPFVAVNCAAFPETLLEAELFGHERGAFTGAVRTRDGRFRVAHGGTLFLDEIAEIPPMAQAKLLRVLQEGTIEPLGTNHPVEVDVRIISATHRNLKERIHQGLFREDLYYRLNVLDIAIPPLRERPGDLAVLVEHFLTRFTPAGHEIPAISPRAWAALAEYKWPGNVRELQHAVERAIVLARGREIDLHHLPDDISGLVAPPSETHEDDAFRPLARAVKEFEREYLLRALTLAEGKKARAAEILGISRKNLWEKLRGHGVTESNHRTHH